MNDDLEYYISFPVADNVKNSISSIDKELYFHGNNTLDFYNNSSRLKVEPVIFLLGWLGAQDRHLAKYSSMYNQLGCITVRYTAPADNLFINSNKKLQPIAKKLLNLLTETSLSNHPIIFHSFSNNGSILYSHISSTLQSSTDLDIFVKGCIFDSTPAPRRLLTALKAFYRILDGPVLLRILASSTLCVYLCFWAAFKIVSSMFTGQSLNFAPWTLMQESFRWPQLFLYSESDDLISYKYVERFAEERESLGVPVHLHNFKDSPHVAHFKMYPDEYIGAVNKFIQFCLENDVESVTPGIKGVQEKLSNANNI